MVLSEGQNARDARGDSGWRDGVESRADMAMKRASGVGLGWAGLGLLAT